MKNTRIFLCCLSAFIFLFNILLSQKLPKDDIEFRNALRNFVKENVVDFGKGFIVQEKFLIEQMRQINSEIRSRITNFNDVREQYFDGLQQRLNELQSLKQRLIAAGSNKLILFVNELEPFPVPSLSLHDDNEVLLGYLSAFLLMRESI